MAQITKEAQRRRRRTRIRGTITGTAARPRLSVFRSNRTIYAQLIDDVSGTTLAAADSRSASSDGDKSAQAKAVGLLIAERAKAAGITDVVFDRGGYLYHGRVKALADAARAAGLEF